MRRKSVGGSVPGSNKRSGKRTDKRTVPSPSNDGLGEWQEPHLTVARTGHPSHRMRVIAITGTSGKTTTAWLTAAVLAEAGLRVGVLADSGCLGLEDDLPSVANYTCAASLSRWLTRLADGGCTHAVVELSGHAIATGVIEGLRSDTVVVTSIAPPVLAQREDETHAGNSITSARAARAALTSLAADGCLVSGAPPARTGRLLRGLPRDVTSLTAGLTADCDITATPVEAGLFGRTVLVACGAQLVPLSLDPPAVPFVRDALLAIAVGARYGVPLHVAARGLEAAGSVPGRLERVNRGQDAAVFLDMPSSGHALSATLSSLRRLTSGRLAVIADESLVDRLGSDEFGPLIARHCDACVLVPLAVLDDDAGEPELATYDRIDRLLGSLGTDDAVLVLGDSQAENPRPHASEAGRFSLATLVDGWLQVAHGLSAPSGRRAA